MAANQLERLRAEGKRIIHFLHIGKNAGTEIQRYMRRLQPALAHVALVRLPHDIRLRNLPESDDYFFSIRDPVTRFKSGFYSRKRKGQPRLYVEWSRHDAEAFSDFEHANDLAESLFRHDGLGEKAFAAIKSIRHTSQNQVDWFDLCGHFLKVRPPFAIIRQEKFQDDMLFFQARLGLKDVLTIDRDEIKSHQNDYTGVPELSGLAVANLRRWYAQDFEFYRICDEWMANMQRDH